MSCDKPYDLIAFAFGASSPEVEDHLTDCGECRAELDELKGVRDRLGSLPEVAPEADFVTRTRQAFLDANPDFKSAPPKTRAWRVISAPTWSWAIVLHAAVFALAAIYFYFQLPQETPVYDIVPGAGGSAGDPRRCPPDGHAGRGRRSGG